MSLFMFDNFTRPCSTIYLWLPYYVVATHELQLHGNEYCMLVTPHIHSLLGIAFYGT